MLRPSDELSERTQLRGQLIKYFVVVVETLGKERHQLAPGVDGPQGAGNIRQTLERIPPLDDIMLGELFLQQFQRFHRMVQSLTRKVREPVLTAVGRTDGRATETTVKPHTCSPENQKTRSFKKPHCNNEST